jgi:hypothetical protein
MMKKSLVSVFAGSLLIPAALTPAAASGLTEALAGGTPSLDIRYRYEQVDQDGLSDTAQASTVRTRLGYTTAERSGFSALIEMEDVHKVGVADYTTPGAGAVATGAGPKKAGHPVVADPIGTELNQSYVQYKGAGSSVRYGRQRIIRDTARFVGNVGWRQAEQTYDALSFENRSIDELTVFAAYISNRNTVTFTDIDMDTRLFDIAYAGLPGGKLNGYYYDVRVDNAGPEWETAGVRYAGAWADFQYALEYAAQEQSGGAEPDYSHVELGYTIGGITFGGGIEVLGGDRGAGFATPLATLHKFNGWADQFLSTPAAGLEDTYFKIDAKPAGFNLSLVMHDYAADTGGLDFGDEVNLLAAKPLSDNWTVGAKLADYAAGDAAAGRSDVEKFWLWAELNF